MRNLAQLLVPSITTEEAEQLKAYYLFYREVEPSIHEEAEKILKTHPFWGPVLIANPRDVRDKQNKVSGELQRDAIFNNNWEPYILNLIGQGITYANMGLDFREWYEIVNLLRRLLAPPLRTLYETEKEKVIIISNGLTVILDIAMGVIGEAYIFEKKRIIEEEKKKQEQLSKEIEQFVYIASHDLQEPLNTVIAFTTLLEEDYIKGDVPEASDLLKRISDSALRMKMLITDLLEYSRVGKKDPAAIVSLNVTVGEVLDDMKASIDASHATVTVSTLPALPVHPISIKLVFQNLLSNSIKFRKKDVPLRISISAERKNGSYEFAVKDNGIGIDPKQHHRIFEMFQRLHSFTEYEGTGIGLAHCQKIVQLHGGNIWIDSKEGAGSTFYFSIPVNSLLHEEKT
jgi:signal transduction histidine kinase